MMMPIGGTATATGNRTCGIMIEPVADRHLAGSWQVPVTGTVPVAGPGQVRPGLLLPRPKSRTMRAKRKTVYLEPTERGAQLSNELEGATVMVVN